MNTAMPIQQRGMSISGFIFGAFLLVVITIPLLKLVPAYIQAAQIKSVFVAIAHDPEMQKATEREIKASYGRRTMIEDITAINADNLDISIEDGKPVISANYVVKIPLVGNISLSMEFNPSSAGK
jgi:hypothetical protein